jgi:hypothetical protein
MARTSSALLLSLALSGLARADNDDRGKMANLAVTPIRTGQPMTMTLRSTEIGQPAALALSIGNGPQFAAGHVVLHLDPGFFFLRLGFVNPAGKLGITATVGAGFTGVSFHAQGLVLPRIGPMQTSNPMLCKVDAMASASFTNVTATLPPSSATSESNDIDSVDLEGDGDADLVIATTAGVFFYVNDGSGQFADETATRIDFNLPAEIVEFGDVDGDGDPDLFVSGATLQLTDPPAPNRLFRNDGSGHFVRDLTFPVGAGLTNDAEFGDLDGDGDLDLVLANLDDPLNDTELPDPDQILINQGGVQAGTRGQFVADAVFAAASYNDPAAVTNDVSLGDIDDDGDLDLFLARIDLMAGLPNVLLENDGNGGFTDRSLTHLQPHYTDDTFESEFVDVNGDGLLDLVVAQSLSSVFGASIMINQGGGVFAEDAVHFPQLTEEGELVRTGLDVADVDGDGDVDILYGVHFEFSSTGGGLVGHSLLFLNQGGVQGGTLGHYAVDPSFPAIGAYVPLDVVLFDLEHDGDLDAVLLSRCDFFDGKTQDALLRNDLP